MEFFAGHEGQATHSTGFAVIDVETTGLYPSIDRVVANRARTLGVRMLTEQVFLHLLDHMRPAEHATRQPSQAPTGP